MLVMYLGLMVLKSIKVVKLLQMDLETDTYPVERLNPALEAEKSAWRE